MTKWVKIAEQEDLHLKKWGAFFGMAYNIHQD